MHILTLYAAASECSGNHFIADKHKTGQIYNVYFLQNSPILQLYTSAKDGKVLETFLEAICVSLVTSFFAFSIVSGGSQKRRPFNADLSQETGKNQLILGQEIRGMLQRCHTFFC